MAGLSRFGKAKANCVEQLQIFFHVIFGLPVFAIAEILDKLQ